jgi:hypothetical protein
VPDTLTFALPEGMKNSFDSLLALAIATLEQAGESDLARWAGAVRQDVQDAPVQERLALDLSQVADSLDKLLDGHPVSRAMVSLIKEIVQMAKAAARTLK